MIKILYITPFLPYDYLTHAGGQTFNYYIKQLAKSGKFEINIVSIIANDIESDAEEYGITVWRKSEKKRRFRKIFNLGFRYNPCHKYGNLKRNTEMSDLYSLLREMNRQGIQPDIIINEWTQMLLGIKKYKEIFPQAYFVASEHDVTYLRYYREIEAGNKWHFKFLRKLSYVNMRKRELKCLEQCDLIKTHNIKDKELLIKDGVTNVKISPLVAFYHNYETFNYNPNSNKVIFYGAMSRPENYEAALWFENEVLPLLKDTGIQFVIIGGNPSKKLYDNKLPNVIITGYVDNLKSYFEDALCMVVPLKLGAGIKVKVLEAMSAGIPVLTNEIGIEGIHAQNYVDYIYCNQPNDYNLQIRKLLNNQKLCQYISHNGRVLLKENFNIEKSACQYVKELDSAIEKR